MAHGRRFHLRLLLLGVIVCASITYVYIQQGIFGTHGVESIAMEPYENSPSSATKDSPHTPSRLASAFVEKQNTFSFPAPKHNNPSRQYPFLIENLVGSEVPKNSPFAYVTFLGSKNFMYGAQVLMESIRKSGSGYDRVVVHLDNLPRKYVALFHQNGVRTKCIDFVENPNPDDTFHAFKFSSKRYVLTYTKFRIWQLTEYRRVILVDSDVISMNRFDNFAHVSTPAASWVEVSFVRDLYNPAVIVLTPSESEFKNIINATKWIHSYDGGELGFLYEYWRSPLSVHTLPREAAHDIQNFYKSNYNRIYNAHMFFVSPIDKGAEKPWLVDISHPSSHYNPRLQKKSLREKKRYEFFYKCIDTFWGHYKSFWSKISDPLDITLKQSISGIWSGSKSDGYLYIRQYHNRITWMGYMNNQWHIAEGKISNEYIHVRIAFLRSKVECICGFVVRTQPAGSLLKQVFCQEKFSTFQRAQLNPPGTLDYDISLNGYWSAGNAPIFVREFGASMIGLEFKDKSTRITGADVLHSIYFMEMGYSSSTAIKGYYALGRRYTLDGEEIRLDKNPIFGRFTDDHRFNTSYSTQSNELWVKADSATSVLDYKGLHLSDYVSSAMNNPNVVTDLISFQGVWQTCNGYFWANQIKPSDIIIHLARQRVYLLQPFIKETRRGGFGFVHTADRPNMFTVEWFSVASDEQTNGNKWWNYMTMHRDIFSAVYTKYANGTEFIQSSEWNRPFCIQRLRKEESQVVPQNQTVMAESDAKPNCFPPTGLSKRWSNKEGQYLLFQHGCSILLQKIQSKSLWLAHGAMSRNIASLRWFDIGKRNETGIIALKLTADKISSVHSPNFRFFDLHPST